MKHKKTIIITGTPGTGKTTLAKSLAKKLSFVRLDLHDHYKEISSGYNRSKQCYDVDLKKLEKLVKEKKKEITKNEEKKGLIIDSHISHLLPKKLIDLCIVLVCPDLKKLEARLKRRKYSKKKIRENLDAEIFQVCLTEAKERKHKVLVIDVGKNVDKEKIIKKIKASI